MRNEHTISASTIIIILNVLILIGIGYMILSLNKRSAYVQKFSQNQQSVRLQNMLNRQNQEPYRIRKMLQNRVCDCPMQKGSERVE